MSQIDPRSFKKLYPGYFITSEGKEPMTLVVFMLPHWLLACLCLHVLTETRFAVVALDSEHCNPTVLSLPLSADTPPAQRGMNDSFFLFT